ncbi:MAG: chromosome partitioning protein ParB [Verrucomicrobia bacterium]|nr:MAG: chromosome partitioning protein ParB [Verrucomicrobiota bacterium]
MAVGLKDRLARQAAGDSQLDFDPVGRDEQRFAEIPLSLIDPDPNQPRKNLGELSDLAFSIREHGVVQPIVVEAVEGGRFRILTGERRFAACRGLGRETIPVLVRTAGEQSRLELQLVENLHRKDLHPVEEARAFKRLMDEFGLKQRDLARRLGKSLTAINQTLRILDIKPELLADVQTSEQANKSVLLEIAKEEDPQRQKDLWQEAKEGHLPVREAQKERGKGSTTRSRKATCTIKLTAGSVIVKFTSGESTQDRVREALAEALRVHVNQAS